jgi:hypothetical protein
MRICRLLSNKHIIEYQNGGSTQQDLDIMLTNAISAGYTSTEVEVLFVNNQEYEQALLDDPLYQAMLTAINSQKQKINDAHNSFKNMTGWATWTAEQVDSYIVNNVTDLASAKVVLRAMGKALIHLRDISQAV